MSGIRRATKLFEGLIFSSVLLLSLNVALALDDDFVADSFLVSANSKAIGVLANEIAEEIGPSFAWGVDLEEKARLALAEYMNLKAGEEYDSIRDFVGYDSYQGDLNFARASVAHTAGLVNSLEQEAIFRKSDTTPNDPRFNELWGMHNIGQTGGTADQDIDAPAAWDITTGDSSFVVGVIDSGVDYNHPDLKANMWKNPGEIAGNGIDDDGNGYIDDVYGIDTYNNDSNPMDDNNHGTHCAGTIGAVGNNGVGVAGVAWNVKIMALKFLSGSGSGSTTGAIQAVQYAVMMANRGVNIKVLSNSWGGGGYSSALATAISQARSAGMLFVAAAGNSAANNDVSPHYPSSYTDSGVLAVAAMDKNGAMASFSCYGATSVDIAAPGVGILSTVPGGGYASYSGTSMATPHVSGIAALILASKPNLSPLELKDLILSTATPSNAWSGKVLTGGVANVYSAMMGDTDSPVALTVPSGIVRLPIAQGSVNFQVSAVDSDEQDTVSEVTAKIVPGIQEYIALDNEWKFSECDKIMTGAHGLSGSVWMIANKNVSGASQRVWDIFYPANGKLYQYQFYKVTSSCVQAYYIGEVTNQSVLTDPMSLCDPQLETATGSATVTPLGSGNYEVAVVKPDEYSKLNQTFTVEVKATSSDGSSEAKNVAIKLTNKAPDINSIEDKNITFNEMEDFQVSVSGVDADGDTLTASVDILSPQGQAYALDQEYNFWSASNTYYYNAHKESEKWIRERWGSSLRWYYIVISDNYAQLYRWSGAKGKLTGRLMGTFPVSYYNNPGLFINVPTPEDSSSSAILEETDRKNIFDLSLMLAESPIVVIPTVTDGFAESSEPFVVQVGNTAPSIALSEDSVTLVDDKTRVLAPITDDEGDSFDVDFNVVSCDQQVSDLEKKYGTIKWASAVLNATIKKTALLKPFKNAFVYLFAKGSKKGYYFLLNDKLYLYNGTKKKPSLLGKVCSHYYSSKNNKAIVQANVAKGESEIDVDYDSDKGEIVFSRNGAPDDKVYKVSMRVTDSMGISDAEEISVSTR